MNNDRMFSRRALGLFAMLGAVVLLSSPQRALTYYAKDYMANGGFETGDPGVDYGFGRETGTSWTPNIERFSRFKLGLGPYSDDFISAAAGFAHGGAQLAYLPGNSDRFGISQLVAKIPDNATSATLSYWYKWTYTNPSDYTYTPTSCNPEQYVKRDTSGNVIMQDWATGSDVLVVKVTGTTASTEKDYCLRTDEAKSWKQGKLDLLPLKGQTVTIDFSNYDFVYLPSYLWTENGVVKTYRSTGMSGSGSSFIDDVSLTIETTDITPPTVNASVATASDGSKTVTLTATDDTGGSGVVTIQYRWDSGSEVTYTAPIAVPSGTHTLHFSATDNAGNRSEDQTLTFNIKDDKNIETPSVLFTNFAYWLRGKTAGVTIRGKILNVQSGVTTLTVNGASASIKSDGSFMTNVTLKKGNSTLTITASNSADAITTVEKRVMFQPATKLGETNGLPQVKSISPARLTQQKKSTVKITVMGTRFGYNPSIFLGNTAAKKVKRISAKKLQVTFTVRELKAGSLNITVINTDGQRGTLQNAVRVY